ncbi:hypothetical protein PHMEG_0002912 [Phytophthora megakarya]|uniref:FAR1 domain-containing protein n=1 Tax=Phytophthora megakarya TaxID=4795 RepID=A0A225WXS9_9STRA|nr:hypothetical protein PHMEG_0002912 [Phytophthora megakarya]
MLKTTAEVYSIPPPPECVYLSRSDAEEALHKWTLENGFNVSKINAAYIKDTKNIHTQYYECDRAGMPKNTGRLQEGQRLRPMRGSKRSGCRMEIKLSAVDMNRLDWRLAVVHHKYGSVEHNHLLSRAVRIHAAHRQHAAKDASSAPVSNIQDFDRLPVAQCWLPGETEEDFIWALVKLGEFLRFHENVVNRLFHCNLYTEAEFESQRKILASKSPVLATYLDLPWWKYKERVVRCWTKQYGHFGY